MNTYTLVVESINLLEEKRKPRKKPTFYYNRLRTQEKEMVKRYKDGLTKERMEHDPKRKYVIKLQNQRLKNRLDQMRLQMTVKKKLKHLSVY